MGIVCNSTKFAFGALFSFSLRFGFNKGVQIRAFETRNNTYIYKIDRVSENGCELLKRLFF